MPCPPSWEELEMMRYDNAFNLLVPIFTLYSKQIPETESFVLSWHMLHQIDVVPSEIEKEMGIAALYSSSEPPRWSEKAIPYEDYPKDINFQQTARELEWYQQHTAELELSLCILRTWIMNHYDPNDIRTSSLQNAYLKERALHLKHRLEEKAFHIKKLNEEISKNEVELRYTIVPELITRYKSKIQEITLDRTRLEGLSEDELLKNRKAF